MRCLRRHSTPEAAMVFTWDPSPMLFIHRKWIVYNQIHKSALGMQIALPEYWFTCQSADCARFFWWLYRRPPAWPQPLNPVCESPQDRPRSR